MSTTEINTSDLNTHTDSSDMESYEVKDMRNPDKSVQIIHGLADAARRLSEQAQTALHHDTLLPDFLNKTGMAAKVEERIAESKPFVYMLIDLDSFKRVNDELGYAVGDEVLVSFGESLREAFRRTNDVKSHQALDVQDDKVGRFGGDEFTVLADASSEEQIKASLARIQDVEADYRANHPQLAELGIGVSFGWAVFDPAQPLDSATLFAQANDRLRAMKHIVHENDTARVLV